MQFRLLISLLLLLLATLHGAAVQATPLVIKDAHDWLYVRTNVEVLEDPDKHYSIEDIQSPQLAAAFHPAEGQNLNFGFSTSAFWIRLKVLNLDADDSQLYLKHEFPSIDRLEFFQPVGQQVRYQIAGDRVSSIERSQPYFTPIFDINAPQGIEQTVYLRVEGEGILKNPLTLLGETAFGNNLRQATIFLGLYFGSMGVMALYNLGLFVFSRNRLHLFYTLLVATQTLFLSCWTGIANFVLYPLHPLISRYCLLVSMGLLIMALVMYARRVMETREYHPVGDRLLRILFWAGVLQLVLVFLDLQPWAGLYSFPLTLFGQLIIVTVAAMVMRRDLYLGLLFMSGWLITLVGVVLTDLTSAGLLQATWVTENLFNVGWVLEAFLFSVALAHRTSKLTLENELNRQARARAEQESHAKRLLLEEVSHDLRTPLHGIQGSAELLANTALNEQQQRYYQQIHASVDSILGVLDNSLAFSRMRSDRFEPQLVSCDPRQLAEHLLAICQPLIDKPDLELQQQLAPDLPTTLLLDSKRAEQIGLNLLNNGIKYTARGFVRLQMAWANNWLEIRVQDSGDGIAADQLQSIFQPYVRLHSQQPGTGLGLALSRQSAETLGGSLTVESEPGYGSCFILRLPAQLADVQAPPTSLQALPINSRILVVDDVDLNLQIASELLSLEGIQVRSARDAHETRQQLQHWTPDLVLMDVQLGDDNGLQLIRLLRKQNLLAANTPAVLMSASIESLSPDGTLPDGIQGLLPKPVSRERVIQTLAPLLPPPHKLRLELLNLVGAERLQGMLDNLRTNISNTLTELEQACQQQNQQQLDKLIHRLQGLANQLELNELSLFLQKQPPHQNPQDWYQQVQTQAMQALTEVQHWLERQTTQP